MSNEETSEGVLEIGPHGIKNVAILDLTWAKSSEDLSGIPEISNVALVIVPANLAEAVYRIPMKNIADIVVLPEGVQPSVMTGQVKMSGESLAAGSPEILLIVTGQFIITTKVQEIGYKEVWVTGQIFVPHGSEDAISKKFTKLTGQVLYYPEGTRMVMMGNETWDRAFIELLPEQTPYTIMMGNVVIEDDVTIELLKSKISTITLAMGNIEARKELLPVVKLLTVENNMGNITEKDSEDSANDKSTRVVETKETWSQSFIELLPEQTSYVIEGEVIVEDDIDVDLLKSKISNIVLEGKIKAPKRLIPVLQLLTTVCEGEIIERE